MTDLSRRALLGGIVTAPAMALPAAAAPRTQHEIAERVHALAEEISHLLHDLDGGRWWVRCSPTFHGVPIVHVQPMLPAQNHVGRQL